MTSTFSKKLIVSALSLASLIVLLSAPGAFAQGEDFVHLTGLWILEGDATSSTVLLQFEVERNRLLGSQEIVVIDWQTVNGTANSLDYEFSSGSEVVAVGDTMSSPFMVQINGDLEWENDEFFVIDVLNITGAQAGNIDGQIFIQNDDSGIITISDALGVLEGDAIGDAQLVFNVSLTNGPAPHPFDLSVTAIDNTAAAGTHFVTPSSPLSFNPGQSGQAIMVDIIGNNSEDLPATREFEIQLGTLAPDVQLPPSNAMGSIQEDDAALPPIEIFLNASGPTSVVEGDSGPVGINFSVEPSSTLSGDVSVDLSYFGTGVHAASDGTDFIGTTNVVMMAGPAAASVNIIGDLDVEFDETFEVVITNVTPLGGDVVAIHPTQDFVAFTILHDDYPGLLMSSPFEVLEGNPGDTVKVAYTVQPDATPPVPINVDFVIDPSSSATSPADYLTPTGPSLVFSSTAPQVVEVDITTDLISEPLETLVGKASYVDPMDSLNVYSDSSVTQIKDDDLVSTMTALDASASETDGSIQFTVSFSPPLVSPQTLNWFTTDGGGANPPANSPADYTGVGAGSQLLSTATASHDVVIPINTDGLVEGDEDFEITFDLNGALETAIGTITDVAPTTSVSVAGATVTEGPAAVATFTVTFAPPLSTPQTLTWTTTDGGGGNPAATGGSDYTSAPGSQPLAAGISSFDIDIPILDDAFMESDEDFTLTIDLGGAMDTAVGTIQDDDGPSIPTVADATIMEGPAVVATFTVTFTPPLSTPQTLTWSTTDGSGGNPPATGGSDYTSTPGSQALSAGASSFDIDIPILDDAFMESDEDFTLTIDLGGAMDTAVGTIQDDDSPSTPTVANTTVTESPASTATFTVTFTPPLSTPQTLTWSTTDGGGVNPAATGGSDYNSAPGSQPLTVGTSTFDIGIPIINDAVTETDEDFTLTVDLGGAMDTAVGTIQDDDASSAVSVANATVTEGSGSVATFTVTIAPALTNSQNLSWTLTDGGGGNPAASGGSDYNPSGGGQMLSAGTTTYDIQVPVLDDLDVETDEFFTVDVNLAGALDSALGKIVDNDQSFVSVADATAAEDDPSGFISFQVTLSNPAPNGASFDVSVVGSGGPSGATLGADFSAPTPTTVTVAAGLTNLSVDVPLIDDSLEEGVDETFALTLTNLVNLSAGVVTATGTIRENDFPTGASVIRITDVAVTETETSQVVGFDVTLTPAATSPVTVDFQTVSTGATDGVDYVSVNGQVQFLAGETSKTINVTVLGDSVAEPRESFEVRLSNPVAATLADPTGVATITDNDGTDPGNGNLPVLSVEDLQITEGNVGLTSAVVRVAVTGAQTLPITVDFASRDTGSATSTGSGADYQSRADQLSIPVGVSEMSFNIQIVGDGVTEADETFEVFLANPINALLGDDAATVTILNDDDELPMIGVELPTTVSEGGRVAVRVTLNSPSSGQVSTRVRVESLTARAGEDFEDRTSNLSWSPGQTGERTVRVGVIDDLIIEGNESFRVMIENLTPSLVRTAMTSAIVTIRDNDKAVRIVAEETELTGRGREQLELVARVVNQADAGVQGAQVSWTSDDVNITSARTTSDAAGEVRQTITLPSQPGPLRVTAALDGTEQSVIFEVNVRGNLRDLFDPENEPTDRDVGGALDDLCVSASGEMAQVCDYVYGLEVDDQKEVVQAITPESLPIKGDIALQATRIQMQNISARQQALRSGGGNTFGQLAFAIQGQSVSPSQLGKGISSYAGERQVIDEKVDSAMASAWEEVNSQDETAVQQSVVIDEREESPVGFFVNGRVSVGEHERTAREPGYDVSTRGITTGVDYKINKESYVGAAIGYIDSDTDLRADAGELQTAGYSFTVYSGFQWNRFYVDAAVSQTWLDFDVQRQIILPVAFNGQTRLTAIGSTDTDQQTVSLGAGYDWNFGAVGVTGFTRGLYNRATIDAFTEQGAGGFNLVLSEQTVKSFQIESGFELSYPMSFAWGVMNPVARFSYLHEFENDTRTIGGGFAFDSTNEEFRILTDSPDRSYFNFGLGAQFTLTGSRLLYFMFDTDLARDDFEQFTLTFGYRQQF